MGVIVSTANRALVLPATEGALNMFPGAVPLPQGNKVIVPHSLHSTALLRHIGFKAPNPMMLYYDWCGGKPFNVQKKTCELLTDNPRAFVLNHMGTGKTKTVLWAWDYLYGAALCGKALVVAPLSTLEFVWASEVFATIPHRKVKVVYGPRKTRLKRLEEDADIYVINHDGLHVVLPELEQRTDIDVLVLDELAVYRNNSERSKVMRKFARRFHYVWGLTGAPMPNEPTDVWAQCKIVTPSNPLVPHSKNAARQILMTRYDQWVWKPRPDAVDTAFKWMQPAVRYALDDVVELPDIVSRTIDVPLSAQQKDTYVKVYRHLCALIDNKQITALNAGVAMNKLLQVTAGWVYTKAPDFVRLDAKPRVDMLTDLITSAERKVLVFVPFRHALQGLSEHLEAKNIEHCVVHGGTKDRAELFNLFQCTTKYKVLLAHPECLAHGLTLTIADTIIWYSPIASLEVYEQANARIRRVGQKHRQQILHLQSTPVEKRIYTLLRNKQKVQNQLLDMFEAATEAKP